MNLDNIPTPITDAAAGAIDQSNFEDSWKDDFEEFAWVTTDTTRDLERKLTVALDALQWAAENMGKCTKPNPVTEALGLTKPH